jgi:hypothetical protein
MDNDINIISEYTHSNLLQWTGQVHTDIKKSIYHQKKVFHLALTNIYLPTQIASIEGIFNL